MVTLWFLKNSGVSQIGPNRGNPIFSIMRLIREYYSIKLYHHFIPLGIVVLFSCAYALSSGNARLIIPIISIGAGLILELHFDTLP